MFTDSLEAEDERLEEMLNIQAAQCKADNTNLQEMITAQSNRMNSQTNSILQRTEKLEEITEHRITPV